MISSRAVTRWLHRKLRNLQRVKRVPLHRLKMLLAEERFDSDSPDEMLTHDWRHQAAAVYCAIRLKWFLALLPGGAGKARIAAETIQHRIRKGHVKRALYLTLNDQATQEFRDGASWHTPKLKVTVLSGTTKERWSWREEEADVYAVSYPGLRNMIYRAHTTYDTTSKNKRGRKMSVDQNDALARLMDGIDMVAMDEIHEAQNRKSDTWQMLLRITEACSIRLALTATATGRKPDSLWQLFFLVDRGESLGTTQGMYRAAFFKTLHNQWLGIWSYKFIPEMMPELQRMCANRALMYEDNETGGPQRLYDKEYVEPAVGQMDVHNAVRAELVKGKQSGDITADSNFIRLRMIASGFATYDSDDNEKVQITFGSAPKLDRMMVRLEKLKKGEKVIIVHEFRYSGKMIADRLRKLRIKHVRAYGDMKVPERRAAKRRFEKDPDCNVFVMNWRVGGAALDFPFCGRMFMYESPVSARYREQCEVRIRRNNSKFKVVRITDFVTRGSVEESVLAYVREGRDLRRTLLRGPQAKQLELF